MGSDDPTVIELRQLAEEPELPLVICEVPQGLHEAGLVESIVAQLSQCGEVRGARRGERQHHQNP